MEARDEDPGVCRSRYDILALDDQLHLLGPHGTPPVAVTVASTVAVETKGGRSGTMIS